MGDETQKQYTVVVTASKQTAWRYLVVNQIITVFTDEIEDARHRAYGKFVELHPDFQIYPELTLVLDFEDKTITTRDRKIAI